MSRLNLFSTISMVKGFQRGILIDFERGDIFYIPHKFIDFINYTETLSLEKIRTSENFEKDEVDKFLNFCLQNELGIIVQENDFKNFTKINNSFEYPSKISNIIIEYNEEIFQKSIDQLRINTCYCVEVIFDKIDIDNLQKVAERISNAGVEVIHFYINEFSGTEEDMTKILYMNFNIFRVFIFNAETDSIIPINDLDNTFLILKKNAFSKNRCGAVHFNDFNLRKLGYFESLHHNSCLNRKVSIDFDGNIKNCPSMIESFGNVRDTPLAEAIEKPGFKKYWNINKDKISVCKDCEFRYICTDCRAYVENPQDTSGQESINLSKPLKCGYNPYTGEWAEWSINPLKQKAIDFYGMRELVNIRN